MSKPIWNDGRGRSRLTRHRQSSGATVGSPKQQDQNQASIGSLTIIAENRTETEIDSVIEDAKKQTKSCTHIRGVNDKVTQKLTKSSIGGEQDFLENNSENLLKLFRNLRSST